MQTIAPFGRYLYSLALVGFGILHFAFGHSLTAVIPLPASLPAASAWVYALGTFFILAGLCLAFSYRNRLAGIATAIVLLLVYLLLHLPWEIRAPRDPRAWTGGFEALGLAAGALVMVATGRDAWKKDERWLSPCIAIGFSAMLIVIGIQHMQYAVFISAIIPEWIPERLFLSYFVGIAFFAVAASLLTGLLTKYSMLLLSLVFLVFVLTVHIPRVQSGSRVEPEWSSLLIATATCGICLAWAGKKWKER